jgi:Fe2+ transport system protein FeoA
MSSILKLSRMKKGEKCRVVSFENDAEIRSRLNDMGLATGSLVEVLTGGENSNYLISVGNTRIGIEPELAEAITVQTI